ncbi:hypothetical protein NQ314_014715 [Rhamnusium bicolor]|uniref:Uncharacterized protein n=1 Tax=Rhamnusium bicolor TaxID=1586634 RepID=A0AAV8X057_9CUCU|nr:hypothetical protein NQ314_014715 [Rhamnusium bicolor]
MNIKQNKLKIFSTSTNNSWDIFSKFSSFLKLQRTIAYCLRFIYNLKSKPVDKKIGSLTLSEMEAAHITLIKLAQLQSFKEEISILSKDRYLPPKHKLSSLTPYLDDNGIV